MKRWMHWMTVCSAVALVACGSDVSSPIDDFGPSATRGATTGGTDTTGGGKSGGEQTSHGPVASVEVTPASMTIPVGQYRGLAAVAKDANGVRVAKMAKWTSSNPSIVAIASDTGVVQAKAVGTAVVTATIDGKSATSTITVVSAPPTQPPPTQPEPVAQFDMTITVVGQLAGMDTSKTERVPAATISLTRVTDSLTTSAETISAVADANGQAKFSKLAGGYYAIRVTPPSGSVYAAGSTGIGRPTDPEINVTVKLQRK